MNRRIFIKTFIFLNIATVSGWYFFKISRVQNFFEDFLKRKIIEKIGIKYYDKYAVKLFINDFISYNDHARRKAYAYILYELTGLDYKNKIRNSYEDYSNKIIEKYILSTNILLYESTISYRLYYDPYDSVCSNFLAEFD